MKKDKQNRDSASSEVPEKFPGKSSEKKMILSERSESGGSVEKMPDRNQSRQEGKNRNGKESEQERSDGVIYDTEKPGSDRSEAA
jgi:hypothetical protein